MSGPLIWLVAGGCPRSGTTALGAELSKSAYISLFHENASHSFFDAIDALFAEERRLRRYREFPEWVDLMPLREKHAAEIAATVFAVVFGARTPIIGTKFPGHQYWPRPTLPQGVVWKEVVTSRNPYDTVLSYSKKMVTQGDQKSPSGGWRRALVHWLHAWNYAVLNRDNPDFLNIMYDELSGDNSAVAQRVADHLGIERDFDLSGLSPRRSSDIEAKFAAAGISEALDLLRPICGYEDWLSVARDRMSSGRLFGYPMPAEGIDFCSGGNSWMHTQSGFYPPELHGTWTSGPSALVTLSVPQAPPTDMYLVLDVTWSLEMRGEVPSIVMLVDGETVACTKIELGKANGKGRTFQFKIPGYKSDGRGTAIEIKIENPRNPKLLGVSNDDRDLGIMLRSLRFQSTPWQEPDQAEVVAPARRQILKRLVEKARGTLAASTR